MKLAKYLDIEKISARQFATRLGVSIHAVRKWKYGIRVPRPAMVIKIERTTKNKVARNDWY